MSFQCGWHDDGFCGFEYNEVVNALCTYCCVYGHLVNNKTLYNCQSGWVGFECSSFFFVHCAYCTFLHRFDVVALLDCCYLVYGNFLSNITVYAVFSVKPMSGQRIFIEFYVAGLCYVMNTLFILFISGWI